MVKKIVIFVAILFLGLFVPEAQSQVIVKVRPKRPKVFVKKPVKINKGHAWREGHWVYNKQKEKYVWRKGQWVKRKPGKIWVKGHWKKVSGGEKWIPGRWK